MKYQQLGTGDQYGYPSHDINPDKKKMEWCMAYAKAAYYDFTVTYPKGVFANNAGDYERNRMYALGKQPVSLYKKMLGVDTETNSTWLVVDWTIRSIVSTYRDKAISRLMKEDYAITCTPIDILSKSEIDKYYTELKAKLLVREMMMQKNPELANHPLLYLNSGEPMDIEELEMRMQEGEQFNRSKDAEMAISLGFYENGYKEFRKAIYEDLFDYGVAGYKEWLGDDNKAKFRRVNPDCVVVNYCRDGTFKDKVHAGEVIDVSLVDLALIKDEEGNPLFTEEELQEFAGSIAGRFGNPTTLSRGTGWLKHCDKFKCKVFDIEFYTYNESVYRDAPDQNGNTDFRKADYERGKKSDKYIRKRIEYVYKCKWVVGTDKCYDWGMCYDQKRASDIKKKARTKLSFSFCAYNFYEMRVQGFMDRLIPYLDEYQLTILKIQNWKNRAVPSGWWINLDMLENVALNKGGKNMQPRELLQMYFETGIMVGRGLDPSGNAFPGNIQPVIPIENSNMAELAGFHQDLIATVMAIEKMTGYNAATMGEANPKTLVPGYELANQSTSDALYPMAAAEEFLTLQLAEDVLCRMKQGIAKGMVDGFAPYNGALDSNALRFIEFDKGLSLRDFGIVLQKRTTEQEKMWIMQQVQQDIANGLLDVSDVILIINTHNAKQAMQILAYRVKKAKENMQKNELAKIQENNAGQQQSLQMAQQFQLQTLQMELQSKERLKQMELMAEMQKNKDTLDVQLQIATQTNQTKLAVSQETADAKVVSTATAGHMAKEKQIIANNKQSSSN